MNLNSVGDPETIPDEWLIERMRIERNRLLTESDWAMTSDAPTDKQAWGTYRQALREFPATWTPNPVVNFPDPPGA